jgi:hypothetical protein
MSVVVAFKRPVAWRTYLDGPDGWMARGDFQASAERSVWVPVAAAFRAVTGELPGRRVRVAGWDLTVVQRVTGCDPYPGGPDDLASTRFGWLVAMQETVRPHAELTTGTEAAGQALHGHVPVWLPELDPEARRRRTSSPSLIRLGPDFFDRRTDTA